MKTGPQQPKRLMTLKLDTIIAFAVFLIVVIVAAVYSHSHPGKPQSSQSTTGWTHYSSKKYGFQFDYPGSWGKPQVSVNKGEAGSQYTVMFTDTKAPNKRNLTVSLAMDTEDYQRKVCPGGQCSIISNPVTSKTLQSDLKTRASSFVSHDSTSYGFIVGGNTTGATLQEQQLVPLPAIKVSAAVATMNISNGTNCPLNKFANPSQPLCVSKYDYDTVNNFLKSIKAT